MIIFLDEKGSVLNKEFENVNQGSNNANKIYVFAPFPENAVVSASFELPNGYVTQNYLMNVILPDVYNTASGRPAKIWELSIQDVPLTEYYGIIKMQIRAVVNQQVIATARIKFKVQEGVDWQLPASPDETTYIQILDAMSRIDEKVVNKVDINYTLGTTEQKIINDYSGLKIVKVVGDLTTTFEVKEDGCFINGEKVMVNEDFAGLIEEIEKIKSGETVVGVSATSLDKPTKVSELENDSGFVDNSVDNLLNYYTKAQTYTKEEIENAITSKGFINNAVDNLLNYYLKAEVYTKQEVNEIVSAIKTISFEVVDELPDSGEKNIIYLLPKTGSTNNVYEEYIYVSNSWEMIGTTDIDLSNYYDIPATDMLLEDLERRTTFNSLNFQPQDGELIYTDGKAYIQGQFTYTTKDDPNTAVGIDGTLVVNIKGGEGVIVDADEQNNTLEVHIDSNIVNTDEIQEITGVKTFLEQIGLKNTNGDVDLIKHINNNFLITSASGQSLINIDEQLEKIYAFNKELAFKDDIVYSLDGTTLTITTK